MVQGTGLANAAPPCQPDNESPQLVEAEAGDGTWQELMELAARARARAHHHFLNSETHDLFI